MTDETLNQYNAEATANNPELPDTILTSDINPYAEFEAAVIKRVKSHFETTDMPADFIDRFGPAFSQFMDNMLAKFTRGQIEHGGDIRDRDLMREAGQEIIDLTMYYIANQVKGTGIICYV